MADFDGFLNDEEDEILVGQVLAKTPASFNGYLNDEEDEILIGVAVKKTPVSYNGYRVLEIHYTQQTRTFS